jgi:hypothetical protein
MKTDLAPKYLYYIGLLTVGLGLIFISIVHQKTMDMSLNQENMIPFIMTSTIWGILFVLLLFILNKCRYLIINPSDDKKFIMGNILTQTHSNIEQLTIKKRLRKNFFKINVDGKNYYMFTFDQLVDDFTKDKR